MIMFEEDRFICKTVFDINKIKDIMDKLEVLAKRGKDPLSYNVNGRRR